MDHLKDRLPEADCHPSSRQRARALPFGTLDRGSEVPYTPLELLDELGFADVTRALVADTSERKRAVAEATRIAQASAQLPTAAEVWEKLAAD